MNWIPRHAHGDTIQECFESCPDVDCLPNRRDLYDQLKKTEAWSISGVLTPRI